MPPDAEAAGSGSSSGDDAGSADEPRVLLFMQSGQNRKLLVETLGEQYRVGTTTDVRTLDSEFDCCVFDVHQFNRVGGTVQSRRDTSDPAFLPFVLLVSEEAVDDLAEIWEYVDDIIELPVEKTTLHSRIGNLVERRRTAVELVEREEQLSETVEDLRLKERAMDKAPIGITIADTGEGNNPLIYANERYQELTGYGSDALGRDCRYLQGEGTDPEATAEIRAAIDDRRPVSVDILNYRKDGRKFWNDLDVAPVRDEKGVVTNFVGFQADITDRKLRERRLEVLNRVLSHNLRNKMNLIQGYLTLLRREWDDGAPGTSVAEIEDAAADLLGLAEAVQEVERTLDAPDSEGTIRLAERMERMASAFDDRFPSATIELALPRDDACEVTATGLATAIEEAVENAIKHNDDPEPSVEIAVERRSDDWIDIDVADDGPGIPSQELDVLEEGETPLRHADRLGIWSMYWVVSGAGGEFDVSESDRGGTRVRFSVPAGT